MNIDNQIREILSRNFPVNDNGQKSTGNPQSESLHAEGAIYVIGNNNVIISSGLLVAAAMTFFLSLCLMLPH